MRKGMEIAMKMKLRVNGEGGVIVYNAVEYM
jgi:hypothetical protein